MKRYEMDHNLKIELQPWMRTMIENLPVKWTPTHIFILIFMISGIFINGGAIVFLFMKKSNTMFHKLLKILAVSDLLVNLACGILWGIPAGNNTYTRYIFPRIVPYLIPISHMAVMMSNFCTGVMGFERFVRFKFLCKFRYRSWISQKNFRYYCLFIIFFPILFYSPKFFELTPKEKIIECKGAVSDTRIIKLVYVTLLHPEMVANMTKKSGEGEGLAPSFIETVVQCIEASFKNETNVTSIYPMLTSMRKNQLYYKIYYIAANTIFGHFFPFVFLVILNILIVKTLNKRPKPDEILISSSWPNVSMSGSTLHVTTSNVRRSFFSFKNRTSIVSTTFVQRENSLRAPSPQTPATTALSPLIFGLDPDNLSYIDSPVNNVGIGETKPVVQLMMPLKSNGPIRVGRNGSPRASSDATTNQTAVVVHDNTTFVDIRPTSSTSSNDTEHTRRSPMLSAPHGSPRLRRHGGQRNRSCRQQPNAQEARLTRISVSIICLYLFCHIWKLIPTLYEALFGVVDHHQWPLWVEFIKNMSHVLVMFNSAVNFLLYLIL